MKIIGEGVAKLTHREKRLIGAESRKVPLGELACLYATAEDLNTRRSLWRKEGDDRFVRVNNDPKVHTPYNSLRPKAVERRLAKVSAMVGQVAAYNQEHGYEGYVGLVPKPVPDGLLSGLGRMRNEVLAAAYAPTVPQEHAAELVSEVPAEVREESAAEPVIMNVMPFPIIEWARNCSATEVETLEGWYNGPAGRDPYDTI